MPNIIDFVFTSKNLITGDGLTHIARDYRLNNDSTFDNLNVEIGFGIGRATSIPWIAFLGYNQKVQRGIYPVLLFYKEIDLLILAYGISENNEPIEQWPNIEAIETIESYFEVRNLRKPKKYGNSLVYRVYDTSENLDEVTIQNDILGLTQFYHNCFAQNIIQENEQGNFYDYENDEDKPFINQELFLKTVGLLNRKKNIIIQGPAGVGKTFIARKIAYQLFGEKLDSHIEMIQFHQSYTYEDFIQGIRPTVNGFKITAGVFYKFCLKAIAHPDQKFCFIIDEINRGNLSKIFGELLMLIETDKRNEKNAIKLTYSEIEDDKFYVPSNLFIIGTMNTADRSLSLVDYALRRRFSFIEFEPIYDDRFKEFLLQNHISNNLASHVCNSMNIINEYIIADSNLGRGFQIGHSYFCLQKGDLDESIWFRDILEFEIRPMLNEIWFDEEDKVNAMIQILNY